MNNQDLSGKVALVTGGTSGIGREAAAALAEAGASVAICGRRPDEGQAVVDQIVSSGGRAIFLATDVHKAADVERAVAATVEAFGKLDIAFNNAGVAERGLLADLTEQQYDRVFDTNVKGLWLSMKYEIQQFMRQGGGGSIINTSSVQGHIAFGNSAHYTASKHAVEGYTKAGAVDYAPNGIRINAIAPGIFHTPMMAPALAARPEYYEEQRRRYPIGRFGETSDLAGAIVFLASDSSRYITGISLPVDGGFLAH